MAEPTKEALDEALKSIEWARNAPTRYLALTRQLQKLREFDTDSIAESVVNLKEIATLEKEVQLLTPMLNNTATFVKAAEEALRELNGISGKHLVTPQIGQIAIARLEAGYSLQQVALMIGCSPGTVSLIKSGRYRYSELPEDSKHGARGRRRR
jgi:hypothetical protein